jgi:hypothetical protein
MRELKEDSLSKQELRLVRLKYTYKFESQFGEPCDEWLEAIEDKCNEILRNINKEEDKALTAAYGARKKR